METTQFWPTYPVRCIDLHPTEDLVAAAADGGVIVFDLAVMNIRGEYYFARNGEPLRTVKFIPQGTQLVVGTDGGHIGIWDYTSHQLLIMFLAHTGRIVDIAVHPTRSLILTASDDGFVKAWSLEPPYNLITEYDIHNGHVSAVVFNPVNADQFATVTRGGELRLFNLDGKTPTLQRTVNAHASRALIQGVLFNPTGDAVVLRISVSTAGGNPHGELWVVDLSRPNDDPRVEKFEGEIAALHVFVTGDRLLVGVGGEIHVLEFPSLQRTGQIFSTENPRQSALDADVLDYRLHAPPPYRVHCMASRGAGRFPHLFLGLENGVTVADARPLLAPPAATLAPEASEDEGRDQSGWRWPSEWLDGSDFRSTGIYMGSSGYLFYEDAMRRGMIRADPQLIASGRLPRDLQFDAAAERRRLGWPEPEVQPLLFARPLNFTVVKVAALVALAASLIVFLRS